MDTRKIVGQLVMPRIDFSLPQSITQAKKLVYEYGVGGFIVFNGETNILRKIILELESLSKEKLFFGCDAERGLGQIVKGETIFPFFMSQGAARDNNLISLQAEITAKEMIHCGINVLFAPVLDINTEPQNPIINIRSLGDNPTMVSELGTAFIKHAQRYGIICCGKHFPGHGSCNTDSHISLPEVSKPLEDLLNEDIVPFVKTFEAGLKSTMIAHVHYSKIDAESSVPATFSKNIVSKLLRKKTGFEGIIFTDSFRMGALNRFGKEADRAIRAVKAGCDIILDPWDPFSLLEEINYLISRDSKLLSQAEKSADRILKLKEDIIQIPHITKHSEKEQVVKEICKKSVCKLKGSTFRSKNAEVYILDITGDNHFSHTQPFIKVLEENGVKITKTHHINGNKNDKIEKTPHIPSILLVYTTVKAWKSSHSISENTKSLINEIFDRKTERVFISFGSPYVTSEVEADICIVAFDSLPQCQEATANILIGKEKVLGKIPVHIL